MFILGEKFFCFVMEVDIKFFLLFCKGCYFEVNLSKIKNFKDRFVKLEFVIYVCDGFLIKFFVKDIDKKLFINEELRYFDIEREIFEECLRRFRCDIMRENLVIKLKCFFIKGSFRFDDGFWLIFFLGKFIDD